MSTAEKTKMPAVLLIAMFDAKAWEALYFKEKIELGCRVFTVASGRATCGDR